jgi:restriction system protein
MVGDELVDWIYENIGDLSNGTRHKLGIIEIPLVIQ